METFALWKSKREKEHLKAIEQQQQDLKKGAKASSSLILSGKDLFSYDPSLFVDCEGAADERDYEEDEDWAEEVHPKP